MNKKVLKFGDEESIFIRDISQFDNITTYGNPHDCDCEFCDYEGVRCPECNSDYTKVIWDNRFEVMECQSCKEKFFKSKHAIRFWYKYFNQL